VVALELFALPKVSETALESRAYYDQWRGFYHLYTAGGSTPRGLHPGRCVAADLVVGVNVVRNVCATEGLSVHLHTHGSVLVVFVTDLVIEAFAACDGGKKYEQ
jgi:hypothetical protein